MLKWGWGSKVYSHVVYKANVVTLPKGTEVVHLEIVTLTYYTKSNSSDEWQTDFSR